MFHAEAPGPRNLRKHGNGNSYTKKAKVAKRKVISLGSFSVFPLQALRLGVITFLLFWPLLVFFVPSCPRVIYLPFGSDFCSFRSPPVQFRIRWPHRQVPPRAPRLRVRLLFIVAAPPGARRVGSRGLQEPSFCQQLALPWRLRVFA